MDHSLEALIGLVGAHGNTLELLELAEEVLDQMAPFVHFGVDLERGGAARMLRDHHLGAAPVEIGDDVVAVEGCVGDEGVELKTLDQRRDPECVEALSGQQHKADEIAQGIGEGQDLGRHAALGAADGLARSPPYMGVEVKRYVISGCPFAMQTRCRSVVGLSEVEPARTHAEYHSASPYIRSGTCP